MIAQDAEIWHPISSLLDGMKDSPIEDHQKIYAIVQRGQSRFNPIKKGVNYERLHALMKAGKGSFIITRYMYRWYQKRFMEDFK